MHQDTERKPTKKHKEVRVRFIHFWFHSWLTPTKTLCPALSPIQVGLLLSQFEVFVERLAMLDDSDPAADRTMLDQMQHVAKSIEDADF